MCIAARWCHEVGLDRNKKVYTDEIDIHCGKPNRANKMSSVKSSLYYIKHRWYFKYGNSIEAREMKTSTTVLLSFDA